MKKKQTAVWGGIIVLVAAIVIYYFFMMPQQNREISKVTPQTKSDVPGADASAPNGINSEETIPAIEVELDESDELVRKLASALSTNPSFARWLIPKYLIRRLVSAVDLIAMDESPRKPLDFIQVTGNFKVRQEDELVFLDPKNYQRYQEITDILLSLDSEGCVELYKQLRLPIRQAYQDLGYSDEEFNKALGKAIRKLLAVPVVEYRVYLKKEVVTYRFVNPELEGLSPMQKALFRMGPDNVRKIQGKLREIAFHLGISVPD